ncbi:hypothetical protein CWE12_02310 [Aliidiomarina sedimenti]|uniref:Uncharacterized protein n=1 Tax=Aliidiomarina sedimenti TaxID=1933879 RepID=A0ABY0C275_9GAMM|nr:hypothetical protein CWE12_02310 [Aliidiomarina sedimenti]
MDLILSRCQRKPKILYQYAWVVGSAIVIPNSFHLPLLKSYDFLYLSVLALTFSWVLYVAFIHLWRYSLVRPLHREHCPGFFKRNIDAIIVAVVSALFGAVIGVATTKMADRVWSNPNSVVESEGQKTDQVFEGLGSP